MTDLGRLGPIIDAKRAELSARLCQTSLDELRARARPTTRSLRAALERPGGRFIFEYKRASPSEGPLNTGAEPGAIARAYTGAADAMSVLVDPHFRGSYADLRAARAAFAGPILAKDFVIDPRQVVEARLAGADAVLAILTVLDDHAARAVIREARQLGMDVLVEVHDEAEMRRAVTLDAPLVGINNRNLRSFRADLSVTERLAPLAGDRTLVAESGICSPADIDRLSPLVDAFLIGSAPMRDPDPRLAARALAFGRVKLCGLRTRQDLTAAVSAAFGGLVFAPGSPRNVTVVQAEALGRVPNAPPLVGVFQDAPIELVRDAARRVPLAAIQLHGREDAPYVAALRRSFRGEIWLARQPSDPQRDDADRLLFDNGHGGTGRAFDWSALARHPQLGTSFLAGGIGALNVRAARAIGTFGIDVGSATDAVPGAKDHRKIAALFDALRPVSCKERMRECA